MLKAQEKAVAAEKDEEEEEAEEEVVEEKAEQSAPFNAFAAVRALLIRHAMSDSDYQLEGDGTAQDHEEEEEEEEETVAAAPKKVAPLAHLMNATHDQTKKKKPKKKKQSGLSTPALDDAEAAATPGSGKGGKKKKQGDKADPFAGMDEVDRALAELNMKYARHGSMMKGPKLTTLGMEAQRRPDRRGPLRLLARPGSLWPGETSFRLTPRTSTRTPSCGAFSVPKWLVVDFRVGTHAHYRLRRQHSLAGIGIDPVLRPSYDTPSRSRSRLTLPLPPFLVWECVKCQKRR